MATWNNAVKAVWLLENNLNDDSGNNNNAESYGGASKITTNIYNQSGQPVSAQTTTQQSADGIIINTVLNALQTNKSGLRTALQAVTKK